MFKVFKNIQKPQLNKQKKTGLHEAGFLIFIALAVLSLLALMTYHPADPGFFHTKQSIFVNNLAGKPGAWFADTFLNLLGYMAYAIPLVLAAVGWMIYESGTPKNQVKRGGANAWVSFLGFVMIIFSGCGLATLHIDAGNLPTYTAGGGGYIGMLMGYILGSSLGSSLILVAILLSGFTLLTDISWFTIMEKIGEKALKMFDMLTGGMSQGMSKSKAPVSKAFSLTGGMIKSGLNHLPGTVNKAMKASGLTTTEKTADGKIKVKSNSPKINLDSLGNLGKIVKNKGAIKIGGASESSGVSLEAKDEAAKARIESESTATPTTHSDREPQATPSRIEPTLDLGNEASADPKYTAGSTLIDPLVASTDDLLAPLNLEEDKKPVKPSIPALPVDLLHPAPESQGQYTQEQLDSVADKIVKILSDYGVNATVEDNFPGPVITRFEIGLAAGTKVSKVVGLVKDIARELGVSSVRVVEVIPGKSTIGLEVPNQKRDLVAMRDVIESNVFKNSKSPLTLVLGKDIGGHATVANLDKMPHLLVAGTTGSGKSVAINAMLVSLLYKSNPDDVRMILIDPKMLELSVYEGIPHLLSPVVTDMKDASNALRWCVAEMERRYLLMSKLSVRNLAGYNLKVREAEAAGQPLLDPLDEDGIKTLDTIPNIVVVVDEFADMMMVVGKKVEELIARLAQKARAAGIHLILATQRPSVDVITGLIKANIPTRIAFQVSTKIDSRTILDQVGAEQLLGMGDMLYLPPGTALPKRVHGAFVSDKEVIEVAAFLKKHGEPDYLPEVLQEPVGNGDAIPGLEPLDSDNNESDPLYDEAIAIVTESRRASISYLQRRLKVGYNRAARMIEDMEAAGVVSAVQSNGTREVLAPPPVALT